MIQSRCAQSGLVSVKIDFIGGSRALKMTTKLHALLRYAKGTLRALGNVEDARVISDWQRTHRYKIANTPHWIMDLDAREWQALSRGLRQIGQPGLSMLNWINAHKVSNYD